MILTPDRDDTNGLHPTGSADGTLEWRRYLCQNWRADVVAIVTNTAQMVEWAKYSSYGVPFGLPAGDTDSDSDCDSTDITQLQSWIDASSYDVRGDLDLDGDVDATDKSTAQNTYEGTTLGWEDLSADAVRNRKNCARYIRTRDTDSELDDDFSAGIKFASHINSGGLAETRGRIARVRSRSRPRGLP